MTKLEIKPLSVNEVWQGKRFKTPKYNRYERALTPMLPVLEIPDGKLHVCIFVGFSSQAADVDNIAKPFLDILQRRYKFDDKRIFKLDLEKTIVKKGSEFISFEILQYLQL